MLDSKRRRIGIITAFALIGACTGTDRNVSDRLSVPQTLEVQLREVLTLGGDTSAPSEYLFGAPRFVVTDSKNHIYVADESVMNIRVFDSSGRYVRTIGRRGQGPLEFLSFRALAINHQDELIVLDRNNARITRFTPEGVIIATHPVGISTVSRIRPFRAGYLVLNNNTGLSLNVDFFFRGYNASFEEQGVKFARADEVIDTNEVFEQLSFATDPGSFVFWKDDILFAPSLYNGIIHRYHEKDARWIETAPLFGNVEKPAYSIVTGNDIDQEKVDVLILYSGQSAGGLVHNRSKGIFVLQNMDIVHFTFAEFGRQRNLGLELYDPSGTLVGYGIIDEIPLSTYNTASLKMNIMWNDSRDRFYIIDWEEVPVIRIAELEYRPVVK